ncbi:thioesterase-like superfamily-domain-containing protein [Chaetomium sp. MPI-CAGE-AT-0009]|nr:thioesterase-like superfamily-domain-containing protein [Chaetomium sp. MPI-CAGE-AT-0009]
MPSDRGSQQPLQEALDLAKLPSSGEARRFMGTRAAYLPGSDFMTDGDAPVFHKAAFGGHVYAQSALAAVRAWRELEDEKGAKPAERLDLHTIHGYFTRAGIPARPFLYTVTPLTASRTFSTLSVTAHQPSQPSTNPAGDHFPPADAALPLSPPCFTALCSFKLPEPHSEGVSAQEPPPQQRFAAILAQRPPHAWPPAPPSISRASWSWSAPTSPAGSPSRICARLWKPLPLPLPGKGEGEVDGDASAHVAAHAYVADRNGLLVVGNHVGFGHAFGRAASLSYSFVVHVNGEEAVMREGEDQWWVQEMCFPRAAAGRGVVESKIWSPSGVHVATEYQDGLVQGMGLVGKL